MKTVIQRVSEAHVQVDGATVGAINHGLMLLVGIQEDDEKTDADWLVQKILNLRIFGDQDGKLNLSVQDISGEILCISQFTQLICLQPTSAYRQQELCSKLLQH